MHDGWPFVPSSISKRTSTSVIVNCNPGNSMRAPANPFGPAVIQRRSTSASGQFLHDDLPSLQVVGKFEYERQSHPGQDRSAPQQLKRRERFP